jgi:hypothetical protein
MIASEPLPEGHTARKLSAALEAAGAPRSIVRRAERGYYHDYLSPLAMPELSLITELRRAAKRDPDNAVALLRVAQAVAEGEHDASAAEGDAWARSPEGRETWRQFRGRLT